MLLSVWMPTMARRVAGQITSDLVLRVERAEISAALTTTDHIPGLGREFVDWVKIRSTGSKDLLESWLSASISIDVAPSHTNDGSGANKLSAEDS
jgi:hypothetical protein